MLQIGRRPVLKSPSRIACVLTALGLMIVGFAGATLLLLQPPPAPSGP
jgi:hypothetical protein